MEPADVGLLLGTLFEEEPRDLLMEPLGTDEALKSKGSWGAKFTRDFGCRSCNVSDGVMTLM